MTETARGLGADEFRDMLEAMRSLEAERDRARQEAVRLRAYVAILRRKLGGAAQVVWDARRKSDDILAWARSRGARVLAREEAAARRATRLAAELRFASGWILGDYGGTAYDTVQRLEAALAPDSDDDALDEVLDAPADLPSGERDRMAVGDLVALLGRWERDWPAYWIRADEHARIIVLFRTTDGVDHVVREVSHWPTGGYGAVEA